MKKFKKILPILMILMLLIPFGSAFAMSGGLLDGQVMNLGAAPTAINSTTTKATDNDTITSQSMQASGSADSVIWYEFGTEKTIESYAINHNGISADFMISFWNSSGTLITPAIQPTSTNGTKVTLATPLTGVKKVSVKNVSSSTRNLREFDVFGPNAITKTDVNDISATNITQTGATLTWSAPTGYSGVTVTGYKIFMNGSYVVEDLPSTTTSYTLSNLIAGTTYQANILANYSDGTTTSASTSNDIEFITLAESPDTIPPSEINSLVSSVTDKSISLTFNNPADADFNHVNVYVDGVLNGTSSTGTYQINGLTEQTTYVVSVKSVDNAGNESSGITKTVLTNATIDTDAPTTPTGVTVEPASNGAVVSWNRNTEGDIQGYNLYVDGVKRNSTPITSLSYSVIGLDPDTTYSITVSAVDTSLNESPKSVGISLQTDADSMPILGVGYDLKDVADASGQQFGSIWLIIAFVVAIPLSFYVASRTKLLFLD